MPVGWKKVTRNLLFNIHMDFKRKAHWVLDGNRNPDPEGSLYAVVVLRGGIRIELTYAALNGLNVVEGESGRLISGQTHHRRTILYMVRSLDWKTLVRKYLPGGHSMEKSLPGTTSEIVYISV